MKYRTQSYNLRFKTLPVNVLLLVLGIILFPVIGTLRGAYTGLVEGLVEFADSAVAIWRAFIRGESV